VALREEALRDQTAEGVADDDRLRLEPADDRQAMSDDVVDAVPGDALRMPARVGHSVAVPGRPAATGA